MFCESLRPFFFFLSTLPFCQNLLTGCGYRVEDKTVRYVAEENIEPINPDTSQLPQSFWKFAGKHFKRWDPNSRTFVSNIRDEYPDD